MTDHDDAVKAAAEALSEYYEGDGWGYFGGAAETAVAAAAPILLAKKDAEIERLRAAVEYEQGGWDYYDAEVAKGRSALAAERARIAAAIRAAGHPDGYHRVDTTREWAGIYCADCAVTERSARIADEYRDWRDFTDRVARPWVESDGDDPKADAYYHALFLGRDPYYLAAALVMADNRLREYEAAETAPEDS